MQFFWLSEFRCLSPYSPISIVGGGQLPDGLLAVAPSFLSTILSTMFSIIQKQVEVQMKKLPPRQTAYFPQKGSQGQFELVSSDIRVHT